MSKNVYLAIGILTMLSTVQGYTSSERITGREYSVIKKYKFLGKVSQKRKSTSGKKIEITGRDCLGVPKITAKLT